MSDIAIRVENLSKLYRIGGKQEKYRTLRDTLSDAASAPFRRVRSALRRGSQDSADTSVWALKDVSFEVKRGEVVGVIGRNGAGKSTLLKILSRITEPTSGRAEIHGRVGSLLEVGTGFHPELTGRENIRLNGAILGMKRTEIESRFDEIVDFAEVEKFIDTPVKHYSSGMYLRLAFAVAAHMEPEILLVDEVLAVGDAQFQKKCLGKMGDVAKEGRTVLFVSHNMAAVESLCEQTVVLKAGSLASFTRTRGAINSYLNSAQPSKFGELTARTDREGSGRCRVQDIRLLDRSGTAREVIQSGEAVIAAIDYASVDTKPIRNVLFEIKVSDQLGTKLFTLSTFLTAQSFEQLPSFGTVYCYIPALLLAPDVYHTLGIIYINNELCDVVPNASQFSIIEGDYFGSGKIAKRTTYGTFLMPQSWYTSLAEITDAQCSSQFQVSAAQ